MTTLPRLCANQATEIWFDFRLTVWKANMRNRAVVPGLGFYLWLRSMVALAAAMPVRTEKAL